MIIEALPWFTCLKKQPCLDMQRSCNPPYSHIAPHLPCVVIANPWLCHMPHLRIRRLCSPQSGNWLDGSVCHRCYRRADSGANGSGGRQQGVKAQREKDVFVSLWQVGHTWPFRMGNSSRHVLFAFIRTFRLVSHSRTLATKKSAWPLRSIIPRRDSRCSCSCSRLISVV
jgi:hypothetical protein